MYLKIIKWIMGDFGQQERTVVTLMLRDSSLPNWMLGPAFVTAEHFPFYSSVVS